MVIKEDLSRNFGYILHDVARLLRTTFDRRVKGMGLTRSQWWVLMHVFRNDGVTQSELADILEIEKATLGRLLDRLEINGWIRRESDANDRRAKRIHLTEAVEPAMKKMRGAAADMRRDALTGLSSEDHERFVDTLLAVKNNLLKTEAGTASNGTRAANGARTANGNHTANGGRQVNGARAVQSVREVKAARKVDVAREVNAAPGAKAAREEVPPPSRSSGGGRRSPAAALAQGRRDKE